MHKSSNQIRGIFFAIVVALLAPSAFAGHKSKTPIRLVIDAPETVRPRGALLTEGWALTFSLEAKNAVAFVVENVSEFSGDANNRQALVYKDPDGCLDMRSLSATFPEDQFPFESGCTGQDEGFFEFYFDTFDEARRRVDLCRSLSGLPPYVLIDAPFGSLPDANLNKQYVLGAFSTTPEPVGAESGGSRNMTAFPLEADDPAFDCYGYGADVNGVPGLVVWADIGGFKVMDENLNGTDSGIVRRLRNGAGFITNVTSVLLDRKNTSYVKATIIVPLGLFEPIVAIDTVINPSGPFSTSNADYLRKIDDGPVEPLINATVAGDSNVARARAISRDLPPIRVTVKAVLVEGIAPDFITDVNMDGRFTKSDLISDGYTLLSNVAQYKIREIRAHNIEASEDRCPPTGMLIAKDLDGGDPVAAGDIYSCSTGSARSGRRIPR